MGLLTTIVRGDYRSENCILGEYTEVVIVNAEGPFYPRPGVPGVVLVRGAYPGTVIALPADADDNPIATNGPDGPVMFGGSFVHTSDSRFSRAVRSVDPAGPSYAAIPLHDYRETWAEYERNSR